MGKSFKPVASAGADTKNSSKRTVSKHSKPGKLKRRTPGSDAAATAPKVLSRAEMKERTKERKKRRVNYDVIQSVNDARKGEEPLKGLPKAEREARIQPIISAYGEKMADVALKHDMSRIVQSCIKYGSHEQRANILQQLKGGLKELSCSQYGTYVIQKLVRYGNDSVREQIFSELSGNCRVLALHRSGCRVLDAVFRIACNAEMRNALLQEFYGKEFELFRDSKGVAPTLNELLEKNPSKRESILESIKLFLERAVNKGTSSMSICHRLLLDYLQCTNVNDARAMMELFREHIVEVMQTADGARCVSTMIALGSNKDRKAIIKAVKAHVVDMSRDPDGHFVLMRALDITDDTVLTGKAIVSELSSNVRTLSDDSCASRVFLHLLAPRATRFFSPDDIQQLEPPKDNASKKEPEKRRTELLNYLLPSALKALVDGALLKERIGGAVLVEVLRESVARNTDGVDAALDKLADLIAHDWTSGDERSDDERLLGHVVAHRFIKRIVCSVQSDAFALRLKELVVEKDMVRVLRSRACWVVNALLEHGPETARLSVRKSAKKALKLLKDESSPGITTLRELVVKLQQK